MLWSDFKAAVLVDLPVDNTRIGIQTYLQQQLLAGVIQVQKIVPLYQAGHETVYGANDLIVEGFASVGTLPQDQQCKPLDAFFRKVGKQCMSQPMGWYDWGNRQDLVCGNPRITGCQFYITIDPWGQQFTTFPSITVRHQLSLLWAGVKTTFLDSDETPFDIDVVEVVGLFAKAKVARMADHDLSEYGSYMSEYIRMRSVLYADTRERSRLRNTANSPQPANKCANSLSTCVDQGACCANPDREHEDTVEFIAFGDSGDLSNMTNTNSVATLVKSLEPDFVMHCGDAIYPDGDPILIQDILIKPYGLYIPKNFYLAFGNHDIPTDGGAALNALLTVQAGLNGGKHYYDFIPHNRQNLAYMHGFVLDSYGDPAEQLAWMTPIIEASDLWNVIFMHEPPYTSDILHAPGNVNFRFDYKGLGAHLVISGHGHNYERLQVAGFPYVVVGTGGNSLRGFVSPPTTGSQFRFNSFFGAAYVTARPTRLQLTFFDVRGEVIDSIALDREVPCGLPNVQTPCP